MGADGTGATALCDEAAGAVGAAVDTLSGHYEVIVGALEDGGGEAMRDAMSEVAFGLGDAIEDLLRAQELMDGACRLIGGVGR